MPTPEKNYPLYIFKDGIQKKLPGQLRTDELMAETREELSVDPQVIGAVAVAEAHKSSATE